MRGLLGTINRFFTGPQPVVVSSIFRSLLGGSLFVFYLIRFLDFDWLFGEGGFVPRELALHMIPDFYRPPFLYFPEESAIFGLSIVFLICLFLLTIGVGGRLLAFLTLAIHLIFFHRNYVALYGPDFIATCWLLYCWLLDSSEYMSVKAFLRDRRLLPEGKSISEILRNSKMGDALNTAGLRLIQVQLCTIYAYGGWEKLKGLSWWRGDAIWNTLANGQLVTEDYGFLSHFPWIIVIMTFSTLLWEIYFPVLVWLRKTRVPVLIFGLAFHAMIGWMMNILCFSTLMMISYVTFLSDLEPSNSVKSNSR